MSGIDLNSYFRLGKTSEDQPTDEPALINTIRIAPESVSTIHNSVKFKLENVGLLTEDSGIVIQPQLASGATQSNVAINIAVGAIACISRCQLLIDGNQVTDLREPAYLEANRLYSRNTPIRMVDYHKSLLGNDFMIQTSGADGEEELNESVSLVIAENANVFVPRRNELSTTTANNKKYFVKLSQLGLSFLRHGNLPLYLLKNRKIELVIDFFDDCREWAFSGDPGEALGASDAEVNLNATELVQTHILVNQETADLHMADIKEGNWVNYPLVESYLIKRAISTDVVDTEKDYSPIRLNLQNRELHKLLMVARDPEPVGNNPLGNVQAVSLGDMSLNYKVNGTFLFDENVDNSALQFYLNSKYNNGYALKVSNLAWIANGLNEYQYTASFGNRFYTGRFNYIGQSFKSGANQVLGGGIGMRTPLDVTLKATPRYTSNPDQVSKEFELNFYVASSKVLTITPNNVMVKFSP